MSGLGEMFGCALNRGGSGPIHFANLLVYVIAISGFSLADQIVSPQDNQNLLRSGLVLQTTDNVQAISVPITQWVGRSGEDSLKVFSLSYVCVLKPLCTCRTKDLFLLPSFAFRALPT